MDTGTPPMEPVEGPGITYSLDQHAFVMAGRDTLFLVHLTMLHMEEHEFEFVLRASLTPEATKAWQADQRQHPDETYFLGNVETGPDGDPGPGHGSANDRSRRRSGRASRSSTTTRCGRGRGSSPSSRTRP